MKNIFYKISNHNRAFTLAEVLAALVIGTMVLITVLGIYNRTERAAAAITRKLEGLRVPNEVLQRIAEDLDRVITHGADTKITIENKVTEGYQSARLRITKTIYDDKNQKQTFEEIVWQSGYDFQSEAEGLVLFRSHKGMTLEDKLLDEPRASVEKVFSFIPVCSGLTLFRIQVPSGERFVNKWTSDKLPVGVVITISFAEPVETPSGALEVPEEQIITRNIAIDRTRKLRFIIPKLEDTNEVERGPKKELKEEPNDVRPEDKKEPNDVRPDDKKELKDVP